MVFMYAMEDIDWKCLDKRIVKAIPAIVWTTGKDDYEKLKEIINVRNLF